MQIQSLIIILAHLLLGRCFCLVMGFDKPHTQANIQNQRQVLVKHSSNRSVELLLEDNALCSQAARLFIAGNETKTYNALRATDNMLPPLK
jgi:hypothetical protein